MVVPLAVLADGDDVFAGNVRFQLDFRKFEQLPVTIRQSIFSTTGPLVVIRVV